MTFKITGPHTKDPRDPVAPELIINKYDHETSRSQPLPKVLADNSPDNPGATYDFLKAALGYELAKESDLTWAYQTPKGKKIIETEANDEKTLHLINENNEKRAEYHLNSLYPTLHPEKRVRLLEISSSGKDGCIDQGLKISIGNAQDIVLFIMQSPAQTDTHSIQQDLHDKCSELFTDTFPNDNDTDAYWGEDLSEKISDIIHKACDIVLQIDQDTRIIQQKRPEQTLTP